MVEDGARTQRVRRASEAAARFAATVQLDLRARGQRAGLSLHSMDATVLDLLRVHGPLTPRELARHAGVTSSGTITGAIDRLERAGWTTRAPCRVDRRKVFVTLTDVADADVLDALGRCTDEQLAAVAALLDALAPAPHGGAASVEA